MAKVPLSGYIQTNVLGYQALAAFHEACQAHQNTQVEIDLSGLEWLDANLCGLLLAMTDSLAESQGLSFFINPIYFDGDDTKFNVLFRNHFASMLMQIKSHEALVLDNRASVIRLKRFGLEDVNDFAEYIADSFLAHRGCQVTETASEMLQTAYCELFDNYGLHAQTEKPVYICGQFFTESKKLNFSMTDVGEGFLKKIMAKTAGTDNPIMSAQNAVKWALSGHTTKTKANGGSGLKWIESFCKEHGGDFHIITDGVYTHHNFAKKTRTFDFLKSHFRGTTIHLLF